MIAMNTALLTNEEPLSRCNGKGADVVNNGKTTDPIIAHKPVSTTDGKPCQSAKAARTVRKPAAPRKKRYDEEDLVAFGENACMLRGAAEAILDMFHALFIVGYLRDIPIIVTDGNPQGNNLHHLVPPFMEASVAAREGLEVASAAR